MLSILGAGSAYPATEIDGSLIKSQIQVPSGCGPRSVLSADYLKASENQDPIEGSSKALESPTQLAFRASQQAIDRAGISADKLGLIIGDVLTPRETTPSEAQRLGKLLNVKVRAFDIVCGSAAFVQQLDVLNNWREERIPQYTLLSSTNTPTENISYGSRFIDNGFRFCDAAASVILSNKESGKLTIDAVETFTDAAHGDICTIDTYGFLKIDPAGVREVWVPAIDAMVGKAVSKIGKDLSQVALIAHCADYAAISKIASRYGFSEALNWSQQLREQGDSFGSSPTRVLADRWDALKSGMKVVIVSVGTGMNYGYTVMSVA